MRSIGLLLTFLSCAVNANNLEIEDVQIGCIDKKKVQANEPFKYRYGVELLIKNSSNKPIILATKINTVFKQPDKNNNYQITLTYQMTTRGSSVLIPPKHKLELVELLPGDKTLVSHQFSNANFIEKVSLEFYSKSLYGGRFNNWVGRLNTQEIKPQVLYKCKT